jgi:hypothetical protein
VVQIRQPHAFHILVGTTPVLVADSESGQRVSVHIRNLDKHNIVYVGGEDVAIGTGFEVIADDPPLLVELQGASGLWAVAPLGIVDLSCLTHLLQ